MQYCIMFKSQIRQLNRNTLYINAKQKHQPKIERKPERKQAAVPESEISLT